MLAGENAMKRVLVGVTGSVAAIKLPELVQQLQTIQKPQARDHCLKAMPVYVLILVSLNDFGYEVG